MPRGLPGLLFGAQPLRHDPRVTMRSLARHSALVVASMLIISCAGPGAAPTNDDFVAVPGLGSTRIDVPRPGTSQTACALAFPEDESLIERAAALRDIGLFADKDGMSDQELAEELEAALTEEWGERIPEDEPLLELFVAALDRTRAWWGDLEADVADGNDVYASTLAEWAAISVGAFQPDQIEETWESDAGPVVVRFTLNDEDVELTPEYLEDWIDPRIISSINERIAPSGRQFTLVKAFDQTAFLLALDPGERDAREARGWCFES
jgi:hypothetical protein